MHGIEINEVIWLQLQWNTLGKIRTKLIYLNKYRYFNKALPYLTHLSRVTYICLSKLTIIGAYNDLSPGRRQAIIWNNAGILLIGALGTNLNEILIEMYTFL